MAKHLSLASYTGSGMVIQQQLPYYLAGNFKPAAAVSVKLERFPLDGKSISPLDSNYGCIFEQELTCDESAAFCFELPALEASFDYYEITVTAGREVIKVNDVLAGEVWVHGGHSEFSVDLARGLDQKIIQETANLHFLRFFQQSRDGLTSRRDNYSYSPRLEAAGAVWCYGDDPEAVSSLGALVWYFARSLQQELHIPVAIIETSMNSTFIHSWLSRESIDSHAHIRQRVEAYGFYRDENTWQLAGDWGSSLPAALYNHKIVPLSGLGIRGVIWHQGQKDHAYPDYYLSALKNLISDWQNVFRIPADKPRSQVPGTDLADASMTGQESNGSCAWMLIQHLPAACSEDHDGLAIARYNESLSRVKHQVKGKIAVLPTYNLYKEKPSSARVWSSPDFQIDLEKAGQSLKQMAAGMLYHRKASESAPECIGIEMVGDKLLLSFSNTAEGLRLNDGGSRLSGFAVCGEDRVFLPAKARILYGVRVLVWHDQIRVPQAVCYAFASMNQDSNLINSEHIAVIPFRSDRQTAKYRLPSEWTHCDRLTAWAAAQRAGCSDRISYLLTEKLPVWRVKSGDAVLSLDGSNKQEGDASLFIKYKKSASGSTFELQPCLEYGSLFPPMDISDYGQISIDVFNPDNQMKKLWICIDMVVQDESDLPERTELITSQQALVIGALRWQSFQFSLESEEQATTYSRAINELKFCFEDSKSDGSVYIDNIRFLAK
ncbi:MAG: hypothetical protein GX028_10770 [Clostridiaceae bacterium]|nr:hypothetical protein [Clostridiaceae bacterium]